MGKSAISRLVYGLCIAKDADFGSEEDPVGDPLLPANLRVSHFPAKCFRIFKYNSDEYPMFILGYWNNFCAQQDYPAEDVDLAGLVVPPDADEKILAYVKKYGLATEGIIGWKLVSYCN